MTQIQIMDTNKLCDCKHCNLIELFNQEIQLDYNIVENDVYVMMCNASIWLGMFIAYHYIVIQMYMFLFM
jgi:hypothetical protein